MDSCSRTTFRLDPQEENVAVFTPSLGLVPYVDIAMQVTGVRQRQRGHKPIRPPLQMCLLRMARAALQPRVGQLRLVKVTVQATGPANRLGDNNNLVLRSSPPMSKQQLLGLIGGNSLASV